MLKAIGHRIAGFLVAGALAAGLVLLLTGPLSEELLPLPAAESEPETPSAPKEAPDLQARDFAERWNGTVAKRGLVELPLGVPLPDYAFQISDWLKSQGCSADSLSEEGKELLLKFSCPPNPQRQLRFARGGRFLPGAVRLALLFRTDGMSIEALHELDALQNPFALVVDPLRGDASLEQDIGRLKNVRPEDIVLSLRLKESGKFTQLDTSGSLYPQLPEDEVRRRVAALFERFPEASAVLPSGSRTALNYDNVSETLADELSRRGVLLLLAPQHRAPPLQAACAKRPGLCLEIGVAADPAQAEEALWKGVAEAKRRGSKILALPTALPALRGARLLEQNALDSGWSIEPMERFRPAKRTNGGRR